MKETKKLLSTLALSILVFVTALGLLSLKAEAKNASDAVTANPGGLVRVEGSELIIEKDGVTLDGYDLNGYFVYINAKNVTLNKCSNITYIKVLKNSKNITLSGNTVKGAADYGIIIDADGTKVTENTITGTNICGIIAENVSDCTISKNKVSGNKGNSSIRVYQCERMTVSENTVSDSLHYGIVFIGDNGSTLKNNTVKNSACDKTQLTINNHGDGILLDTGCNGTKVIGNKVDKVGSLQTSYGNGLIVGHDCVNVVVKDNEISNAGWYGIQVTYKAQNITVENNIVYNSPSSGISVSRDSSADLSGNKVYNNNAHGIVYDGQGHTDGNVRVKGTASDNECFGNKQCGIYIVDADIIVSNNNLHNNAWSGIRVEGSSETNIASNTIADNADATGLHLLGTSKNTVSSNYIYKSSPDLNSVGIRLEENSEANLVKNRIANYGEHAVFAGANTLVKMGGNQASIARKEGFKENCNAYYTSLSTRTSANLNNNLIYREITTSSVKGQTFYLDYTSGAVVGGKVYKTKSQTVDSQVNISVTFPNQSSTDDIVLFTSDNDLNSICINASKDFVLDLSNPESKAQVTEFVKRFYKEVLGRPQAQIDSDTDGINNWTEALLSGSKSGAEVAYGFVNSTEFKNRDLNNDQFVNTMYMSFFNRQPDPEGYEGWYKDLQNGSKTRLQVFEGFVKSQEFKNLCAAYGINPGTYTAPAKPQDPVLKPLNVETQGVNENQLNAFVERLYDKALERPSDAGGKAYWKGCILNGKDDLGREYDIRTVISKG
ncbi:MAG: right-handed parallel beta-helix repeat-containing protein, partial [Lachnospiraceae bacterium]|nr:right-handed parallel beta-helix repeat-containing protein [Lachnospiraceae bacterium]